MPDRPGNARTGLLSLIMLGVLLASTAAAWWLCQGRGTQRRLAGELLREIQAGGLDRHWADSPDLRWFLGVSGGRPVAWRAYSRKRQDQDWNGVILARTSRLLAHADWTLSQDARTGRYVAVYGGGGSHATTVRLEAGTLIVEERSGPVVRTAASPAPENYLPEGLLSLVIRRVAQRGQEAAFLTTLDSESIDPAGAVQFVSVRIMPKGAREVRVEYGQRGEVAAFVYFLDAGGEIDRIDDLQDDINYRKTALEDLRKVFPETGKFLDAIRRDDPNAEEEQAPRRPGVSV